MPRHLWIAATCLAAIVSICAAETPKIAIHVRPAPTMSYELPCDHSPNDVPCSELAIEGLFGRVRSDYFIYLIAEQTNPGMTGASFGIAYDPWVPRGLDWLSRD